MDTLWEWTVSVYLLVYRSKEGYGHLLHSANMHHQRKRDLIFITLLEPYVEGEQSRTGLIYRLDPHTPSTRYGVLSSSSAARKLTRPQLRRGCPYLLARLPSYAVVSVPLGTEYTVSEFVFIRQEEDKVSRRS